jgi:hypothetical protein
MCHTEEVRQIHCNNHRNEIAQKKASDWEVMGSYLNVRSWLGFLLGQMEITCWLEVVEWCIIGLPYAWISLLSVSIAAVLHKVAVKLRYRDMLPDCLWRRNTYCVFAILVQTVKIKRNHHKTVSTVDVFVACDHCINCWHDSKSFMQAAKIIWLVQQCMIFLLFKIILCYSV